MKFNILIVKETRANERRVALIPRDVENLIQQGHVIYIEHNAGLASGYPDEAYQAVGAIIRNLTSVDLITAYQSLFANINLIARVKRPERKREILEYKAITKDTIMIGALDPLERHSTHVSEYKEAKIKAYSIDQLDLSLDDPMNILVAMSRIAGKLAMLDAFTKCIHHPQKIVIIGFGTVGQAAFYEAINNGHKPIVCLRNQSQTHKIEAAGGKVFIIHKEETILQQRAKLIHLLIDTDIIVTSARKANHLAPILITDDMLQKMKPGCIIVDMALSEGGNVEGSMHDTTRILGNNITVTNTSGYPKSTPEASPLWSIASLHIIDTLNNRNLILEKALLT